jgi:hypothetical protein
MIISFNHFGLKSLYLNSENQKNWCIRKNCDLSVAYFENNTVTGTSV